MTKEIWFDMDGTIADLYGVENWLDYIRNEDTTPYNCAKPLVNMSLLARYLNRLIAAGWKVGIISWTAKDSTEEYAKMVGCAKMYWLLDHLPSVEWDILKIVPYGTNKWEACGNGILFDDEERNRQAWENGYAYTPQDIMKVLKACLNQTSV